ncbi:helix-turn-helix domain-containing protein [Limosilactobacillus mucosae]
MIFNRLKMLLSERELSITQVAKDTGLSRTTLTYMVQNNSKGIQLATLNQLCQYLHVQPKDLLEYYPFDLHCEFNRDQDKITVAASILENGQIVQKAQLTGKMTDDTCKIAYTELEKQFADYYVKMSIFAKTLLKNQFKAAAEEKTTQDIELI